MSGESTSRGPLTLDEFLGYSSKSGGGAYLKSWKEEESFLAWVHPLAGVTPYFNHPIPKIHEREKDGEKELVIWSDRWGCHEVEEVSKRSNFRRQDGSREMPPVYCPACFLVEWVYQEVRAGRMNWLQPLFSWSAGGEDLVVVAGGMYNAFRDKDITRVQKAEMRRANIRGDEAWKQDMRARLQFLFHVVDDAHPDRGVQKTFEGKGLAGKLQKAISDEMKRSGREVGNPSLNPYPFRWEYDASKDFDDKYNVIAMQKKPSAEVDLLLKANVQPFDLDVGKGDCWSLRANLEEHQVQGVEIPWDRIFAGAEKRGFMKPASESKADRGDNTDFDPKKLEGEDPGETKKTPGEPVVIGPEHAVWTDPEWIQPTGSLKGRTVLLDPPDDMEGSDIDDVRQIFQEAGAVVGEYVACDYCSERMTTLDDACPHCHAGYSSDGKLVSKPCLVLECGGQVMLGAPGDRAVCGKCGKIHEEVGDSRLWSIYVEPVPVAVEPAKEEPPPPPRRRRGTGVPFDR